MVPEKHKITLVVVELMVLSGGVWLAFSGLITPLMLIGGLMLVSPLLQEKFYSCEIIYWVCTNIIFPKTVYNPYIWGALAFFLGFSQKLHGINGNLLEVVKNDPYLVIFEIIFLLIILLASLRSLYSNKNK